MNKGEESIEPEFTSKLDDSLSIDYEICFYCKKPYTEKLWCKECDPCCILEGWTSGNEDIDKFKDINQIGEGGFAKVYSATWIDGKTYYEKQNDGSWKKREPEPIKVALKKLKNSQNMSAEYLNELKAHWNFSKSYMISLQFYGVTKDPNTKEFMMVVQFADQGNLRSILSRNFNKILWKDKIACLFELTMDLRNLHGLGYFHKDLHSGNILQISDNPEISNCYISDFGMSGPSNEQRSGDKTCGVLPYIAPEVLNGELYTSSSDIYSVGVIMAELSSGKPPFYKRKHDVTLALEICNGLRPEFGQGTPEIYKELAYKCMSPDSNQRPTANKLFEILKFWCDYNNVYQEKKNFGYKGKDIKAIFEEADKEIPNISTSYEKDPDAIYTSRSFSITNIVFVNYQDSQLSGLKLNSNIMYYAQNFKYRS